MRWSYKFYIPAFEFFVISPKVVGEEEQENSSSCLIANNRFLLFIRGFRK